ncbi:hypothetical protein [Budvicia aquatica]|uniref:Uncharacterized protein n=1 Tax=Budvicia aquatica TaxID=82979 RepID=A0A2C6DGZ1_9GAMM|nr:hypothetical protein [Budvicia aquatica]MBP9642543.1 hypothetical protein [Budvicia sp.]PHI28477.1 hypothetical protein CRN84_03610 [Budvicia aquatica]VFS46413.1 Uncharacterised protein [Budvicia aquatica]
MKLIGSRNELNRRNELLYSERFINKKASIVSFLNKRYNEIKSVYVLAQIQEQDEDIYKLIVNSKLVVSFKLSRTDESISDISEISVLNYKKSIEKKADKLDLAIALDMLNTDIQKAGLSLKRKKNY